MRQTVVGCAALIDLAATIERMEACGMSADMIVMALKCLVVNQEAKPDDEPKRSAGAERTARWRERHNERHKPSQSVTSDASTPPLVPPLEGSPKPLPKTPPISPPPPMELPTTGATIGIFETLADLPKPGRGKPRIRGHPLSLDFEPDGRNRQLAATMGFSAAEIADMVDRMRDWAANAGQKGLKSDWQAAFRNWMKGTHDRKKLLGGGTSRKSHGSSLGAAFDELEARFGGNLPPPRP